jgi:hypothetical protein
VNAVQVHNRVQRIQRAGLPGLDFIHHGIGDRRDQCGRYFSAVHFFKVTLDFPHRHAARIQRQDLVVEAGPAGLMFGNELRFEAAVAVPRNLKGQAAEIALERLGATAVACVAGFVGNRFVLAMSQMLSKFCLQRTFHNRLGELL